MEISLFVVPRRPAGHLCSLASLTERGGQSDDDDEDEDGQADGDPNLFLQRDERHKDVQRKQAGQTAKQTLNKETFVTVLALHGPTFPNLQLMDF